jgi:predicted RNA-binding Zn-ribbon protein involved in translation (DUF1610 family)
MATIRASCPDCGEVEFTSADVSVRITAPDGSGTYSFRCPGCVVTVVKSAEPRTIDLLLASGVKQADSGDMMNALPSGHDSEAQAITHDDLLDFHDLLARDDSWFDELLGSDGE